MGKISEITKNFWEKFKNLSIYKKIIIGIITAVVVILISWGIAAKNSTPYSVLFYNLDKNDAKTIQDKLTEEKIQTKYSGNNIMVPSDKVDQLRIKLATEVTGGSKGWELFDSSNSFVSTDAENKVKYQQALQGELEKTLKAFPQIDAVKVNLVLPEDSVFVKDATQSSASVALRLKEGKSLSEDNVRAIVSLLAASVKNLPKENIQIVDNNMKLLTTKEVLNKDNVGELTNATDKQLQYKKDYEKNLEDKVMAMLGKAYKNKVTVKVNADMNFDAVQQTSTIYNPDPAKGGHVVVSEHNIKDTTGSSDNTQAGNNDSPVSNNMVTTSGDGNNNTNNTNVVRQDSTVNYENGKTEAKSVKAPGEVKRITASVIIDGDLDTAKKNSITNIVNNAIGFNVDRGDAVTVEGLAFDNTDMQNAQKAMDDLKKEAQKEKLMSLYRYIIVGGVSLLALLIMLAALRRKNHPVEEMEPQFEAAIEPKGIDVVVGDEEVEDNHIEFAPINFDEDANSERVHIEKEIKKYAMEKPEQVLDIIKSWLVEEER